MNTEIELTDEQVAKLQEMWRAEVEKNSPRARVAPLEPDDFEARIKRLNGETNGD